MNLKERLRLIKTTGRKPEPTPESGRAPSSTEQGECRLAVGQSVPAVDAEFAGWHHEGDFVRSRTIVLNTAVVVGEKPASITGLGALLPDVGRFLASGNRLLPSCLTFFDLETTGLSGGAGTVAFLAAFARQSAFGKAGENGLAVTQYLLLDYPGETLFLQKCLEHLACLDHPDCHCHDHPGHPNGLVVSYNGKSFDSQIIKSRCIVNAIQPPFYHHADLVHPARYLWKRKLPSCRQRDIEERVLGLNRGDDLPGSFAPDAWLGFLKTGEKDNLLKICAHNIADIGGLAAIWNMFAAIADSPLDAARRYNADLEHLALRYRNFVKRRNREDIPLAVEETAVQLLEEAAAEGSEIARLLWERRYGTQLF